MLRDAIVANTNHRKVFVYIVMMPSGPLKIGSARNVARRLAMLQTGNPEKLTILSTYAVAADQAVLAEKAIHRALYRHRLIGEWFRLSPEQAKAAVESAIAQPHMRYRRHASRELDPIGRCGICRGPIRLGTRYCSAACRGAGIGKARSNPLDLCDPDIIRLHT